MKTGRDVTEVKEELSPHNVWGLNNYQNESRNKQQNATKYLYKETITIRKSTQIKPVPPSHKFDMQLPGKKAPASNYK